MKVRYFAWMKRTVGVADEEVAPPTDVRTVGDLVVWLRSRSNGHAEALAEGAATLEELRAVMAGFEGSPLRETAPITTTSARQRFAKRGRRLAGSPRSYTTFFSGMSLRAATVASALRTPPS